MKGRRRRQRAGWTLRSRLVLITVALTMTVSVVVGLVSVLSLRVFLEQRLDDQLTSAVRRSRVAVDRPADTNSTGANSTGTNSAGNSAGSKAPGGDYPGTVPPMLSADRGRGPGLGFLVVPGQGQGTLGALIDTTGITRAAVLDSTGTQVALSSSQRDLLATIPRDSRPHTVDFGADLGGYRVLAQQTPRGEILITGLPLSSVQAAVYQLLGVVTAVGAVGLVAAALMATVIVRRALRPLNRVAATATSVSELPLDRGEVAIGVRVPEGDTDPGTEVGQVGAALNRMLGHVAGALQARQSSEARVRRFVADASHELRTPLASIRGYAELTRRGGQRLPADVTHALSRVESEAVRMTALVEELLMLARLDEGRPGRRLPVDLSRLLVDAAGDAHAAGPGHRWQLDLPAEPVEICGDEAQIYQVLTNLLANARVHTPIGTLVQIRLRVRVEPDPGRARARAGGPDPAPPAAEAVLEIIDDGPGIPADLQPEVFERFARGDGSRSRGTGSTGLGLAIVSAVVTSHGGRVDLSSRPGATRFCVRLPLVTAADGDGAPTGQVAASTSRAMSSRSAENSFTERITASATRSAN